MIKFVDLNTGNTFNGQQPYIFWFDGEQSTNIWYSHPICFISNEDNIRFTLETNDIFKLISPSKLESNTEQYSDLNTLISDTNSEILNGKSYQNIFIYIVYVIGYASQAGEYIETFKINDQEYKIGADFYREEESLYINLSNMGVDIPEDIQKSIYCSNLREDNRDNILLNRKWKELLSNYFDTVANKGSAKSLLNTLKWFEYGDLLKISEMWKIDNDNFLLTELKSALYEKYKEIFDSFSKSTYLSISCALEHIKKNDGKILYDKQKNPILEKTVFKWSTEDMALKMSILGHFYETYFLPIHLDLIHCTIEDIVYTNTFKKITTPVLSRKDIVCDYGDLKCNIHNDSTFYLDLVQCYVGPETIVFKNDTNSVGVQRSMPNIDFSNDQIMRSFVNNIYNNIGAIVDFEILVRDLDKDDKIKREVLYINDEYYTANKMIEGNKINFSLLFKSIGTYKLRIQLDSIYGKTYTKELSIKIADSYDACINIYKLVRKNNINKNTLRITEESLNDYKSPINDLLTLSDFGLTIFNNTNTEFFKQYIPVYVNNEPNKVCLNHILILEESLIGFDTKEAVSWLRSEGYNIYYKDCIVGNLKTGTYYICINSKFGDNSCSTILPKLYNVKIIRDDLVFIPEYFNLIELDNKSLNNCTIKQDDFLCIIPNIKTSKKINEHEYEWEFINESLSENDPNKKIQFKQNNSIRTPFAAKSNGRLLEPGYYSIKLKYSFTNGESKMIKLDSAFRVK